MNYSLIFLLIALTFLGIVGLYFSYSRKRMEEKRQALEEEKFHHEVIEHEEQRVKDELSEVHEKANMILSEAEKIATELINELEDALGKKGEEVNVDLPNDSNFEIELGSLSDRLKNNYVNRIKHLLVSVEKFEYQKAKEVEEFAEEQQVTTDKNLQKIRAEALQKMHERIERYKEEELSLFDRKVEEVVNEAAKEVLGHSLTNQEHQEIIKRAIERARTEKVI